MAETKIYTDSDIRKHCNALYLELPEEIADINRTIIDQLRSKINVLSGRNMRAAFYANQQIDGGEECQAHDSSWSTVMRILEGHPYAPQIEPATPKDGGDGE